MAKKKKTQQNKQRQQRQQAKRQRNEKKRRARREAEKKNAALSLAPLCLCCGEPMVLIDYDHALPAPMGDNDELLLDDEFFAVCQEVAARVDQSLFHKLRDDVDVVDALVDALRDLGPEGFILVVTPKVGRPGQIDPADLEEGVTTAGMALTRSESLADDWLIYKVVRPRGRR